MTDLTHAFKTLLGPGARKTLAREACVSPDAVKRWFAGEWPAARSQQFDELIIRHCDRQQRELDAIRRSVSPNTLNRRSTDESHS